MKFIHWAILWLQINFVPVAAHKAIHGEPGAWIFVAVGFFIIHVSIREICK